MIINAFPQSEVIDYRIFTQAAILALETFSLAALERVALKFLSGEDARDNKTFCPSVAEIVVEVGKTQDVIDAIERSKRKPLENPNRFTAETRNEALNLGFMPGEISRMEGELCFHRVRMSEADRAQKPFRQHWLELLADKKKRKKMAENHKNISTENWQKILGKNKAEDILIAAEILLKEISIDESNNDIACASEIIRDYVNTKNQDALGMNGYHHDQ